MKKSLFLAIAATAMLASCSNNEVMEISQSKAISFDNLFVNNSTRAALNAGYNSSTLPDNIEVYGSLNNGTNTTWIFDKLTLSKTNNWSYSPAQYWISGNDYKFYAFAPANKAEEVTKEANTLTSFRFGNDGETDLLYAIVDRSGTNYNENEVKFELNHLLSKVKFTMYNGFTDAVTKVAVSNIEVSNIREAAIYSIANEEWSSSDQPGFTVNFGNIVAKGTAEGAEATAVVQGESAESNYERFLIPEIDNGFTVSFTATLYVNEVEAGTFKLKTDLTNIVLEQGKSYNFIATLTPNNITGGEGEDGGLNPIEFNVAVTDWEDGEGWDVPTNSPTTDGTYNGGEITTDKQN